MQQFQTEMFLAAHFRETVWASQRLMASQRLNNEQNTRHRAYQKDEEELLAANNSK